ncbi:ATP dependent DNA ligase domain-containing protein 1 [Elsinoe fawcettii]|nr:ATP dependent DNA ligase domain-containing protein 1 [Elsinoe fawcettii]
MSFKFSVFCHLLSSLEDIHRRDPPLLPIDRDARVIKETQSWFKAHRRAIDGLDTAGAAALLSSFLPERRTDRVYGMQHTTLARTLCRSLGLSSIRSRDLNAYKEAGHGDLADCLERVLDGGGPPALPAVTLEEVDKMFLALASGYRYSSPGVRDQHKPQVVPQVMLVNIIRRSMPNEAKWLVRLLLKDLSPVKLDEHLILKSLHFLLPDILRFQHDFDVAVQTLKGPFRKYPSCPDAQSATLLRKLVSGSYRPQVGIKISRSTFTKARSIDHCIQMTKQRRWMVERKYDGEYCEIHVDLSKGQNWLKIFSKSGKDSTEDRHALKDILRKSLAIDSENCKVKSKCVLLTEMVVYSEQEKQIMPFHKIRKYVPRSGTFLGTAKDSPRHHYEHLMVVFFDLLLHDDNNVMQKSLEERKSLLQGLVRKKVGRAIIAESKVLDFADSDSKRKLMNHLAASVAARHEGLVLKPCGRPYLAIPSEDGDSSTVIKLKKDYINGLGDEADLAVVGASYDAQLAISKGLSRNSYTHFHVGCLTNPDDVERYQARPCFKVVGTISADSCIPPTILPKAITLARLSAENYSPSTPPSSFDLTPDHPRMDTTLRVPFVFEVLGSSYEKPSNCSYWMLRHPRVKKLHEDRTWLDCVAFRDLQKLAKQALSAPVDSESQENLRWMARIERSCRRKIARASAATTPTSPLLAKRKASASLTSHLSHNTTPTKKARIKQTSPISKIQARRMLEEHFTMDEIKERVMLFNVPSDTVSQVGECAFVIAATEGRVRSCPLSGSVVCIPLGGGDRLADLVGVKVAALHGAETVFSVGEMVGKSEWGKRGVVHVPAKVRGLAFRLAGEVGRVMGKREGGVVELVDVLGMGEVCAGVHWVGVEKTLAVGYEWARRGSVRYNAGEEETVMVVNWEDEKSGKGVAKEKPAVVEETQEEKDVGMEEAGSEEGEIKE